MPDALCIAALLCTVALLTNVVRLPDALHSVGPRLSEGGNGAPTSKLRKKH